MVDCLLYLHRIMDNRVRGSALKSLNVFQKICGLEPAKRVAFVTTMWDRVPPNPKVLPEVRENQLKSTFWSSLIEKGASVHRFDKITENAWKIVDDVLKNNSGSSTAVQLQKELVDQRLHRFETEAAKVLYDSLTEGMEAHKNLLMRLEEHARTSNDSKEEAQLKAQIEELNKQIKQSYQGLEDLKINALQGFLHGVKSFFHF